MLTRWQYYMNLQFYMHLKHFLSFHMVREGVFRFLKIMWETGKKNANFHLFVIIGDKSKSIASVVHIDQSTKLAEFGLKILIKNNYKFKHNIFKNLDICIGEESAPVTKGLYVFGLLPGIHFEDLLSCERQTACTLSHHLFPSRFSFLCSGVTELFRQGPSTNSRETLNIC